MKSRLIIIGLVILNLTVLSHVLLAANCTCDSADYGWFQVNGPRVFSCSSCPGNIGYRWDCDSTNQDCFQGLFCGGGCQAGCFCAACTTSCTQASHCPCQ